MKYLVILTCLIAILSCEKDNVPVEDVIYDLTLGDNTNVIANGSSTLTVSVKLNRDADTDKRKVVFTTSSGTFDGATADNGQTITKPAEFVNGELIATVTWKCGRTPSKVVIAAKPEAVSTYKDFIVKDSFDTKQSEVAKIVASASSFSVPTDFEGEIQISGALKNSSNKDASTGYAVRFEDFFAGGIPAGGRYREVVSNNIGSTTVSAYYSPGHVVAGTSMYVRISLLDAAGQPTSIRDSVFFNVIQL